MTQPPNAPGEFPAGGYPAPAGYPPPPAGGYPPPPAGWGQPPVPPAGYPPPPSGAGYPPPPPGWGYPAPSPPAGPGYPPPPAGAGYPSPPAGAGYPSPPAPEGGYFPPPPGFGAPPSYSVGDAFKWAWSKFGKNAGPLIVAALVYAVVMAGLTGLVYWLLTVVSPETFSAFGTANGVVETTTLDINGVGEAVLFIGSLVLAVVGGVIASAWYGGLLDIANGQPVSVGSFFRPRNVVAVVLAALIVGFATSLIIMLGTIVPIVGPLLSTAIVALIWIFTFFTTVAIVDRNLSPIDGIRSSITMVKAHFGEVLLAWIVFLAIVFVGALACFVGLLAAMPIAYLFKVYTWRKLTGSPVAPANV